MIDQTKLPFSEEIFVSEKYKTTCFAIQTMIIRGAGTIGAAAGLAMMQAVYEAPRIHYESYLKQARFDIEQTRPTAVDLFRAVERVYDKAFISSEEAYREACKIVDETSEAGRLIGIFGNALIKDGYCILTHCNARVWFRIGTYH
jgi:methylthioribose-1-phosphate isomerase